MTNQTEDRFLTPMQKRIVAAGGTALATVILVATAFYLFVFLKRFVASFQDVLLPLAIAAILATLFRPAVAYLDNRTRLNRTQGILLLYFLVILGIGVITAYFVPFLIEQITAFIKAAPSLRDNILDFIKQSTPGAWAWLTEKLGQSPDIYLKTVVVDNSETIKTALTHLQNTVGSIGGFFGSIFGKVAAYSIVPVYLFYILNGNRNVWRDLHKQLSFIPADRREDLVFLAKQFSDILVAFFRGQIIIGLLLGIVLAAGFMFVGLKFGIILGLFLL